MVTLSQLLVYIADSIHFQKGHDLHKIFLLLKEIHPLTILIQFLLLYNIPSFFRDENRAT